MNSTAASGSEAGGSLHGNCVGMGLTSICCLSSALGMLLMKHSGEVESDTPCYLKTWWLLGFLCLALLPLPLNIVALSSAPLAVIAPLAGLTMLFSLALARVGFLSINEEVSWGQLGSVILMVMGVGIIAIFGPTASDNEIGQGAHDSVVNVGQNGPFMTAFFLLMAVIASLVVSWFLPLELSSTSRIGLNGVAAGASGACSNFLLKVLSLELRALLDPDAAVFPAAVTISLLLSIIFFAALQLYVLNSALEGSASFAIPLFQSMLITFQIPLGGFFYNEFGSLSRLQMSMFSAGLSLVCIGVVLLSMQQSRRGRGYNKFDEAHLNSLGTDSTSESSSQ